MLCGDAEREDGGLGGSLTGAGDERGSGAELVTSGTALVTSSIMGNGDCGSGTAACEGGSGTAACEGGSGAAACEGGSGTAACEGGSGTAACEGGSGAALVTSGIMEGGNRVLASVNGCFAGSNAAAGDEGGSGAVVVTSGTADGGSGTEQVVTSGTLQVVRSSMGDGSIVSARVAPSCTAPCEGGSGTALVTRGSGDGSNGKVQVVTRGSGDGSNGKVVVASSMGDGSSGLTLVASSSVGDGDRDSPHCPEKLQALSEAALNVAALNEPEPPASPKGAVAIGKKIRVATVPQGAELAGSRGEGSVTLGPEIIGDLPLDPLGSCQPFRPSAFLRDPVWNPSFETSQSKPAWNLSYSHHLPVPDVAYTPYALWGNNLWIPAFPFQMKTFGLTGGASPATVQPASAAVQPFETAQKVAAAEQPYEAAQKASAVQPRPLKRLISEMRKKGNKRAKLIGHAASTPTPTTPTTPSTSVHSTPTAAESTTSGSNAPASHASASASKVSLSGERYRWHNHGNKVIAPKGEARFLRKYYRCSQYSDSGCRAVRTVDVLDGQPLRIQFRGTHNHAWPARTEEQGCPEGV
ncbi:unnamed protein product [Closterium sp. Yama58-4]|nr:unnamed protein product [Closterium sp. Yama58-4]